MENDRRLLAAAIFALAAAYFLTNLHKAIPQPVGGEGDDGGVFIYNTVTGNVVLCRQGVGPAFCLNFSTMKAKTALDGQEG
jgi:hypothetical protein